jgi:hypothetical protein
MGTAFLPSSMSNHDKVYENLLLALDNDNHIFANAEESLKRSSHN